MAAATRLTRVNLFLRSAVGERGGTEANGNVKCKKKFTSVVIFLGGYCGNDCHKARVIFGTCARDLIMIK